jgi:hypothetical protein
MKLQLAVLALAITPFAIAAADQPAARHRPPPAAFAACKDKKVNDACTVTIHDHAIAGTCQTPPDAQVLACRPDQPPPPPKASLDACGGKAAGDACSFEHDGHALSGSCWRPDASRPLACRPQH